MKVNGYVLVLAAGVLWGTIGLFVNGLAALDVGPASVSALRMGAGAMVMLPVMLVLGVRDHGDPLALLRLNPRQALVCAVMGVFCLSLSNTLYYVAMGAVGMSTASVLLYTSPVFACLLGRLFLGESVTRPKLAALALNVGGCVLAVTNGALDTLGFSVVGVAAGVGAGFLGALLALCGKAANRLCRPLTVTFYEFAFGCLAMVALAFPLADVRAAAGPSLALLALGFGLLPTALAYMLYNRGLAKGLEASKVPVVASVETVVTVVVGIGAYGEVAGAVKLAGIACVLLSIVVMNVDFQRVRRSRTLAYLRENAAFSMSSWSQEKAAAYRDLLTHDDWEAWIAPR